ncbi:helix-turn-helix transcriptional regulator [Candidatus Enterococcus clewellii]|uniref:HTH cro/C1-type domain-containing protein n=1 Tax=Candidatus Enterococcus clewellii TaxID=1834193 RepID=A0AAQ3VUQ6_9ENTE
MKNRIALTTNDRKKRTGIEIKKIRKRLKLTQPEFGKIVNQNAEPLGKKIIYGWEHGLFYPSKERFERIAELGNTTVNELKFGTLEDYIMGLIVYRDSIITYRGQDDISLFDYLEESDFQEFRNYWKDIFPSMDDKTKYEVAKNTTVLSIEEGLTHYDLIEIAKNFLSYIENDAADDIITLTNSIKRSLDWFYEDREENTTGYAELRIAMNQLEEKLDSINKEYSKYWKK